MAETRHNVAVASPGRQHNLLTHEGITTMLSTFQKRCIDSHIKADSIGRNHANEQMYVVVRVTAYAGPAYVEDVESCNYADLEAMFVMRSDAITYAKGKIREDAKHAKRNGGHSVDVDGLNVHWLRSEWQEQHYTAYVVYNRGIAVNI